MLQESLIYRFVYSVYSYFGKIWPDSLIALVLRKMGAFFKAAFSGSSIWNFVAREGSISRSYEGSLLFRFIDGFLNLPQRLLHPLYKKVETVILESVIFKAVLFLLNRLHLLIAGFLFVALVIEHKFWNNWYSTLAITALLLLYFLKTIVDGKISFRTGAFNVFLVLFILCIILSDVFSIMPSSSIRYLAFYLTCFMLVFLIIATVHSKKEMNQLLAVTLTGISIAGIYGVYQQIIHVPVNPAWVDTTLNQGNMTRVFSFFENPNNFAEIILLFLPFFFAALFNANNAMKKFIFLAGSAPVFLSLLFTQTRIAWIAFVITAFVYIFFKEKRLIPVFIILGIIMVPFLPQSVLLRIRTITNLKDSSLQTRFKVWQTVLPILKDYWVTGLGLGNETLLRVSRNYYIFVDKGSIPSHCHNIYLEIWIETGITGIITFLAFMGTLVKSSIKKLNAAIRDAYVNNILIAGISSLAGILAIGMAEHIWFYPRNMLFFWAVIGIMLAALNIGAKETALAMDGCAGKDKTDESLESDDEEQDVAV